MTRYYVFSRTAADATDLANLFANGEHIGSKSLGSELGYWCGETLDINYILALEPGSYYTDCDGFVWTSVDVD